jgi:CheY-like chemotaxis protein
MSKPGNGKKRILIIEDEPDVASYLEMVLRDGGYDTEIASDGNQGMEAAKRERPDLVTLDISMPKASGSRFYKDIKTDEELSSIPVVIVTAVTGYGGDPYGYEKFISNRRLVPPPDGFLPKPIDPKEFLETIDELLSK